MRVRVDETYQVTEEHRRGFAAGGVGDLATHEEVAAELLYVAREAVLDHLDAARLRYFRHQHELFSELLEEAEDEGWEGRGVEPYELTEEDE